MSDNEKKRSAVGTFFVDASQIFTRVKTSILKRRKSKNGKSSKESSPKEDNEINRTKFENQKTPKKSSRKNPTSKMFGINKSRFTMNRTGSVTVERTSNFLRNTFIGHEIGGAYFKSGYERKALCCFYLPAMLFRFMYLAWMVMFLDDDPEAQTWRFLIINVLFMLITLGCMRFFVYKGLKLTQEIFWLIWSVLLIANAIDDKQPEWDLGMFWLIMVGSMFSRFVIMVIEIFYFLMTLKDVLPKAQKYWTEKDGADKKEKIKDPEKGKTSGVKFNKPPKKPEVPINSTYLQHSK